jgi:plastocyanin
MRALRIAAALLLWSGAASAQSLLERSPNLHGTWGLQKGTGAFLFAHRFEFLNGGDQLLNIPTLTLAVGLPLGLTAGLAYTSNSEIVRSKLSKNETEYWLKRGFALGGGMSLAGIAAYNGVAQSLDGAVSGRAELGRLALLGEVRGFSDLFATGDPAMAGAVGAIARLTPYLAVVGDVGKVLSVDSFNAVWSAGVALAIPGSPHTLSFQATNGGAMTLQAASRDKAIGAEKLRYGFEFTVPLGNASQWARIFRPAPPVSATPATGGGAAGMARVPIRMIAYTAPEVHIRVGQSVEWTNFDPTAHTVTGENWGSDILLEGAHYVRQFDQPGRYPYRCLPHPQMTGIVIVEGP